MERLESIYRVNKELIQRKYRISTLKGQRVLKSRVEQGRGEPWISLLIRSIDVYAGFCLETLREFLSGMGKFWRP